VELHLNLTYDDFVSTNIIEHDGLHSCLPIDVGVCVLGGRENMLQIVQKRKKEGRKRKGKHVAEDLSKLNISSVHALDFFWLVVELHLNLTYDDFVSTNIIEHVGLHYPLMWVFVFKEGEKICCRLFKKERKERKGKENMLQSLVHTLEFFLACGGTAFKFDI